MTISVNDRPLVTIALIAYNSEPFIREAVESVLAQTYSPLEIILSDDCSTDGSFAVICDLARRYNGPHRVVVNRNATNLGGAEHISLMLEMARGEFIVQAEGDDVSVPERTTKLVECWLKTNRSRDLICSYFAEINEGGQSTGYIKEDVMFMPDVNADVSTWRCGATGATASYTPKLYQKYGPIHHDVLAVDWVIPFRAWLEGGVEMVREPLIRHRTHSRSISQQVKNLEIFPGRSERYALRRKIAAGEVATTQEWLKAWRIGRSGYDPKVERDLERLIQIQIAERDVFDVNFVKRLGILARVLRLGDPKATLGLFIRHILKIY